MQRRIAISVLYMYTPRRPVRDAHVLRHKGPTCEKTACVSEGTTDVYVHIYL